MNTLDRTVPSEPSSEDPSKSAGSAEKAAAPPGDGAGAAAPKEGDAGAQAKETKEAKEAKEAKKHDPPAALREFMMRSWKPSPGKMPEPIRGHDHFEARRRSLGMRFPNETLIVPTGHEKVRANDTHFPFRPGSDFYYLTGNLEPDCVLVMVPREDGSHQDVLFVEGNPGRSDVTFFTDRVKGELWVGPRLGVEQSRARFAVHECKPLSELKDFLAGLNLGKDKPYRLLRGFSKKVSAMVQPLDGDDGSRDKELATVLSEMRLLKDAMEIRELRTSITATKHAFEDVIRALRKAKSEREVEGVFNLRARVLGNGTGYGTIAACGHHACILHWTRNDGAVSKGELLLLDAGVEGQTLYTADITRTLPVSGKFSKEQREIYSLVLKAQRAALMQVKPGNDFLDPNRAAMRVLTEGLVELGILSNTDDALKEENQFYRRYTLHNVSHMLGLDVHDCAQARQENYKFGKLKPGMVLTVEPGLYFQMDDLTVPAKYRGIGVRIEDDVLVTSQGMRNLSDDIPTDPDEIEAWMKQLWKKSKK